MGTSQSQPTEQPNKATERVTEATPEATPSPAGSKLMAIETTAADQAKLSANHREAAVVKEANPSPSDCKPPAVEKTIAKQAMLSTNKGNHQAAVVKEAKPTASNNCFMVYARDLSITWSEDNRYWQWPSLQENSGVSIEVAELLNVCWLEVHGKFETAKLSSGTLYEVIFVVKLKATTYGWEVPVNLRLTLPDGSKQWRTVYLKEIPTEQWAEIPIGEFQASHEKLGSIEFSLYEYDGGKWKKGLVIKGVAIRPKK